MTLRVKSTLESNKVNVIWLKSVAKAAIFISKLTHCRHVLTRNLLCFTQSFFSDFPHSPRIFYQTAQSSRQLTQMLSWKKKYIIDTRSVSCCVAWYGVCFPVFWTTRRSLFWNKCVCSQTIDRYWAWCGPLALEDCSLLPTSGHLVQRRA